MAVQAFDQNFGIDGHAKSVALFRRAHFENSDGILNATEGIPVDTPRPLYDPGHADNAWPLMVHHPEKGELTVGKNLKGVEDPKQRAQITKDNEAALSVAMKSGYRREPFVKPQVALMDPATEKLEMQKRNQELQGMVASLTDLHSKLEQRLAAIEQK